MSFHKIPNRTMCALLHHTPGKVAPASPFASLVKEEGYEPIEPHVPWLRQHGLLLEEDTQGQANAVLVPSVQQSLGLIVRPRTGVTVTNVTPGGVESAVYVSDGLDIATAMRGEENCLISEPLKVQHFIEWLAVQIGAPSAQDPYPVSLRTSLEVMSLVAILASAGLTVELQPHQTENLERAEAESVLRELFDADKSVRLIEALIADHLLMDQDELLSIHPNFRFFYEAMSSGEMLEIRRFDFTDGQQRQDSDPIGALFIGPEHARCMVRPVDDDSEEIIFTRPSRESLMHIAKSLVCLDESGSICSGCGAQNRPGLRFCETCGKPIHVPEPSQPRSPDAARAPGTLCPTCGTRSQSGMQFCEECGQRLI